MVVDHICVVASAAIHRVGTQAAINAVRSSIAQQHVVQFVTDKIESNRVDQCGVLKVVTQAVATAHSGNGYPDLVDTFISVFGDGVRQAVDHIDIVAQTANQGVITRAPIEQVTAVAANQLVITCIAIDTVITLVPGEYIGVFRAFDGIVAGVHEQQQLGGSLAGV